MSKEMFSKEQYSDAERICRVWDVIEIKNLMGRRTFYNAQGQRRREIEELWVQAPDRQASASYGTNDGYLTGMASIKKHYVEDFETAQAEKLRRVAAANPEKVLDSPEFFGVGTCVCEPLTTPLVELSADGVYAKGTWFTPGQKTDIDVDSASAKYVYGKIFADFAKENGQWKIFHLFFGEEYAVEAGDPLDYPTELEKEAHPELYPKVQKESTGDFFACEAYTMKYNYCHLKEIPTPFATLTPENCYGYEAEPAYRQKEGF